MAMKLYSDSDIQDIADAIRSKNGSSDTYKVSQMATAISNIPSGGGDPFQEYTIAYGNSYINQTTEGSSSADLTRVSITGEYTQTSKNIYATRGTVYSTTIFYMADPSVTESNIGEFIGKSGNWKLVSIQQNRSKNGGPFLLSMTNRKVTGLSDVIYKYNSCSVSYTNQYGSYVIVDKYGIIKAVFSSISSLATALQNKTIDMTNGICILGTWCTDMANTYDVTFTFS